MAVFRGLKEYLSKSDEAEQDHFHDVTLPSILCRTLCIEELCPPEGMRLLLQQHGGLRSQTSDSLKFRSELCH